MSNSLGKTKTDNWSRCGENENRRRLTMGGCCETVADEAQRLLDIQKASRNAPHEDQEDKAQENDQEVDQDETDPYNEVIFGRRRPHSVMLIGPTRSCSYWNSSVRRIKDEITENKGNLERGPSMASSYKASRRRQEKQKVRMEVGRSN
jgi:hypothetical protein